MHQAANVQFGRAVGEFASWRAVPEDARSPAPAWWWGPAFEVLGAPQPMPAGSFVTHFGKQVHWDGAKDEDAVLLIMGEGPATATAAEEK